MSKDMGINGDAMTEDLEVTDEEAENVKGGHTMGSGHKLRFTGEGKERKRARDRRSRR